METKFLNYPLGGGLILPLNVDFLFFFKWNLHFSSPCEKLTASVLVLRSLLKVMVVAWLCWGWQWRSHSRRKDMCWSVNSVSFPFLFFMGFSSNSLTKYCFSQKCHTTLKTKSKDSPLSLYGDDLLRDLPESHDDASYSSSTLHHFDGTLHSKSNSDMNVSDIFKLLYKKDG